MSNLYIICILRCDLAMSFLILPSMLHEPVYNYKVHYP
jgi:hypothetical protein